MEFPFYICYYHIAMIDSFHCPVDFNMTKLFLVCGCIEVSALSMKLLFSLSVQFVTTLLKYQFFSLFSEFLMWLHHSFGYEEVSAIQMKFSCIFSIYFCKVCRFSYCPSNFNVTQQVSFMCVIILVSAVFIYYFLLFTSVKVRDNTNV